MPATPATLHRAIAVSAATIAAMAPDHRLSRHQPVGRPAQQAGHYDQSTAHLAQSAGHRAQSAHQLGCPQDASAAARRPACPCSARRCWPCHPRTSRRDRRRPTHHRARPHRHRHHPAGDLPLHTTTPPASCTSNPRRTSRSLSVSSSPSGASRSPLTRSARNDQQRRGAAGLPQRENPSQATPQRSNSRPTTRSQSGSVHPLRPQTCRPTTSSPPGL